MSGMIRRFALPLLLLAALSVAAQRAPRLESTRPPLDLRDVVGVVPHPDRIDFYWLHTDERIEPVRPRLYRTVISADGLARLSTTLVRQFDEPVAVSVSGDGANVQLMWSNWRALLVSPLVDGTAVKYPQGKAVAFYALYAGMSCHGAECAVTYDQAGARMAAIVDADGGVVSGPFALPSGTYPMNALFDERGIFFLRHTLTELRAALVARDGSVRYDVPVAAADPRAFHAVMPGVTRSGSRYVVAFAEFGRRPVEVHTVTVADDGTVGAPVPLLQTNPHQDLGNNVAAVALAWNGSRYLAGVGHVIGAPLLAPFDAAFHPAGEPIRGEGLPSTLGHPDGSSFVLLWRTPRPYVTILKADGSMTPRLEVAVSPARRRAIR